MEVNDFLTDFRDEVDRQYRIGGVELITYTGIVALRGRFGDESKSYYSEPTTKMFLLGWKQNLQERPISKDSGRVSRMVYREWDSSVPFFS